MHASTIRMFFLLSQFAVFFYMTATNPMKRKLEIEPELEIETKKPIDSKGTLGYYILSEQIKEREGTDPEKLANFYRDIENKGKFDGKKLPFKLTLQYQIGVSLFAAYESKIEKEDNDTTIPCNFISAFNSLVFLS
jgi:hypothetical protein